MNKKYFVLANACARIDFDLLISDAVRSMRGIWGEIMEITLPDGMIMAFVDEKSKGWIKFYKRQYSEYQKVSDVLVNEENLDEEMKKALGLVGKELN